MPYKSPEKRRAVNRANMQKKRASQTAKAEERKAKRIRRGGDRRYSTGYEASKGAKVARRGLVDSLTYNEGNAGGGKPRQQDLKSQKGRRPRLNRDGTRADGFVPDVRSSSHQRALSVARQVIEDSRVDPFDGDLDARRWFEHFYVRGIHIPTPAAVEFAMKIRRLGPDAVRVASILRAHSDLDACPRETVYQASGLGEKGFADAWMILASWKLFHEHTNTWPYRYSFKCPDTGTRHQTQGK